jgi:NADH dehydrogenase FAD-containing subunit
MFTNFFCQVTSNLVDFDEDGKTIKFEDGSSRQYDDIILATGFRHGLEEFLDNYEMFLTDKFPPGF